MMVFESFNIPFSLEILRQGAVILAVASVMAVLALLLGKILYARFPAPERAILQYGTLVTNSGFVGLPVVGAAFGSEGMFLGSWFIIPTRILMWSAGISLFTDAGSWKERAKKVLLNPSIIAMFLGIIRMVLSIPLPSFLDKAMDGLGDCSSPLGMVIVGAILADVTLREIFDIKTFLLVLVRQIILPGLCLVGMGLLGMDPVVTGVAVILSCMPIGSTTAILAAKYGADARLGSSCIFVTTLTSMIIPPILAMFV